MSRRVSLPSREVVIIFRFFTTGVWWRHFCIGNTSAHSRNTTCGLIRSRKLIQTDGSYRVSCNLLIFFLLFLIFSWAAREGVAVRFGWVDLKLGDWYEKVLHLSKQIIDTGTCIWWRRNVSLYLWIVEQTEGKGVENDTVDIYGYEIGVESSSFLFLIKTELGEVG